MEKSSLFLARYQGVPIKALTLQQPWATLLAYGFMYPGEMKQIETRSWGTAYRGPVAIHAAATFKADSKYALKLPAIKTALRRLNVYQPEDLPLGKILAVGMLQDVKRIVGVGVKPAQGEMTPPPAPEYFFGDYDAGRFGWHFSAIHLLPRPIPATGALSLWAYTLPE